MCFKHAKNIFYTFSLAVIVTTLYIPENILHKAPPAHEFISYILLVGLMAAGQSFYIFSIHNYVSETDVYYLTLLSELKSVPVSIANHSVLKQSEPMITKKK